MRLSLIVSCCFLLFQSTQHNAKSRTHQQSTQQQERGTQESPLVVKVSPTPKSVKETEREEADRQEKTKADSDLVNATYTLAAIGILQLIVFGAQAVMLKKTVDSGTEQSKAMDRHIGEAERSADAMEDIAGTIKKGNQLFTRAYLTVVIGGAIYQERRQGKPDLKFQGNAEVVNTGNTPARKIRIRKNVAILAIQSLEQFDFPLPPDNAEKSAFNSLGAHQKSTIEAMINDFVPDAEVEAIKTGLERALCIWGVITYEDIFGETHHTKFGHWLYWQPDKRVFGYYIPGQNDAD
jgi:hypothetical protein